MMRRVVRKVKKSLKLRGLLGTLRQSLHVVFMGPADSASGGRCVVRVDLLDSATAGSPNLNVQCMCGVTAPRQQEVRSLTDLPNK